jgi:hypothetical protein
MTRYPEVGLSQAEFPFVIRAKIRAKFLFAD